MTLLATTVVVALFVRSGPPPRLGIHDAALVGDAVAVQRALAWGVPVDTMRTPPWWWKAYRATPLVLAIESRDTRMVRLLIRHGADVNHGSPSPLFLAECVYHEVHDKHGGRGSEECEAIIELLRRHGADSRPPGSP